MVVDELPVEEMTEAVKGDNRAAQEGSAELRAAFPKMSRHGTPIDKGNEQGNVILMVDVEARQLLRNWKQRQRLRNYSEAIKQCVALAVSTKAQAEEGEDDRNQRRLRELQEEETVKQLEAFRGEELLESAAYWGPHGASREDVWTVVTKLAASNLAKSGGGAEVVLTDDERKFAVLVEKESQKEGK